MVCAKPVSRLVRVITTPGTLDPDGSVTVPTTLASCASAKKGKHQSIAPRTRTCLKPNFLNRVATLRIRTNLREFIKLPPHPDCYFVSPLLYGVPRGGWWQYPLEPTLI